MSEPQDLITAARNLADATSPDRLFDIDGTPAVIIPEGYQLKIFADHRPYPIRIVQAITATDLQSWLDYWNRFADAESTAFFDNQNGAILGILDYHEVAEPENAARHGSHRISYTFPKTTECARWEGYNGKPMNQVDFARFIEDVIPDILEPSGAYMLEVATTLQAKTNINFAKGVRLDNGQTQLLYQEEVKGSAGVNGRLDIPQTIKLAYRLFKGGDAYQFEARFRYRIQNGDLTLWYELVRPERIFEAAMDDALAKVKAGMVNGHIITGTP